MLNSIRDVSTAHNYEPGIARILTRSVEDFMGLRYLRRLSRDYDRDRENGHNLWELGPRYFGFQIRHAPGALENIPAEGPLICVANHPFGILDGMIMGYLLSARRGKDFKMIAYDFFTNTEDLAPYVLPVFFDKTPEAARKNLSVRREALDYLDAGGALGVFPSGQVATAHRPFGPAMDRVWQIYAARLISRSDAVVVPIYFEGQNGHLFQMFGRFNNTVRRALFIREFVKSVNSVVDISIGSPIDRDVIAKHGTDSRILMDYLRRHTYSLAKSPVTDLVYGWDYTQAHEE